MFLIGLIFFHFFFFKPIHIISRNNNQFKGTLSGLRQFLATESPLKLIKKAFYFTSEALFVRKII